MNKKIGFAVFAMLLLAISAGGYAVFGASKDKKAEASVNEAKASAAELYSEMEEKITDGEETGNFEKINGNKLLKVETLISIAKADLEHASGETALQYGGMLQKIIIPKLEKIQAYNEAVAYTSTLFERIDNAKKLAAENPLSPELLTELPNLKKDVIKEDKRFADLKEPFHELFAGRYVEEVEKLEAITKMFVTAEQSVQSLIDMSTDEKADKADFYKKVDDARRLIGELKNEAAIAELEEKLNGAIKVYEAAAAERAEAIKKKEEEAKKKEEEAKKKDEEAKKKEEQEAKIFKGSDGTVFELAEGAPFDPEWTIAQKHQAMLYHVPQTDVYIIVKNKVRILTMSAGSIRTNINHGDILADLLAGRGYKITQKDVQNVVKSGSPFEKEEQYFRVYREGNELIAETW